MKKEFQSLLKKSNSEEISPELGLIQEKLNFCSNVNLKQFLILFEELSNDYKVNKTSFSWKSCFGNEDENHFCSDEVSKTFAKYPEMTNTLIKVLNGTHYTYLNTDQLMIQIMELIGNTIDSKFDRANIIGDYGNEITKTES